MQSIGVHFVFVGASQMGCISSGSVQKQNMDKYDFLVVLQRGTVNQWVLFLVLGEKMIIAFVFFFFSSSSFRYRW
jgi:hypothetical protein